MIVRVREQPLVASVLPQMTFAPPPQLSTAPTVGSHPGIVPGLQPIFISDGELVKTGGVVSFTVMVWSQLARLPQESITVYARAIVYLFGHEPGVVASIELTLVIGVQSDPMAPP